MQYFWHWVSYIWWPFFLVPITLNTAWILWLVIWLQWIPWNWVSVASKWFWSPVYILHNMFISHFISLWAFHTYSVRFPRCIGAFVTLYVYQLILIIWSAELMWLYTSKSSSLILDSVFLPFYMRGNFIYRYGFWRSYLSASARISLFSLHFNKVLHMWLSLSAKKVNSSHGLQY